MPINQIAWLEAAKANPLVVREGQTVSPGPSEILIKNRAIAINPVDWKIQDYGLFVQKYPFVLGEDVSGTVAEVGSDVEGFEVGDRVFAHPTGLVTQKPHHGGFQHYTIVPVALTGHLPDHLTFEQGCVMPLAFNTAASGLFEKDVLALNMPQVDHVPNAEAVVVWGGSSSVGAMAVQLAKAAGYVVITTASKRSHHFCIDIGADKVFDYKEEGVVGRIVDSLNNIPLAGVYDAISEQETVKMCGQIAQRAGGKQMVACTLPGSDEYDTNVEGVEVKPIFALVMENSENGETLWHEYLPAALKSGSFKPKPDPFVVGEGLEYVQEGMDKNKAGVSASKVVISLPEGEKNDDQKKDEKDVNKE